MLCITNFQRFLYHQRVGFLAAFGWFFIDYNPKSSQICTKFSPVMQCKAKYDICYGFWYSPKNSKKWSQKNFFFFVFFFFQSSFGYTLPCPIGKGQIFCQMEGLMKIHNCGKFHLHSICGSQVINFQKFLWQWNIHDMGHC